MAFRVFSSERDVSEKYAYNIESVMGYGTDVVYRLAAFYYMDESCYERALFYKRHINGVVQITMKCAFSCPPSSSLATVLDGCGGKKEQLECFLFDYDFWERIYIREKVESNNMIDKLVFEEEEDEEIYCVNPPDSPIFWDEEELRDDSE